MKTSILTATALALATATFASTVSAQHAGKGQNARAFGIFQFDNNQDARVTKQEFEAGHLSRFSNIDVDNDGFVTPEEMKANREAMRDNARAQRFSRLDTNSDGTISSNEFEAAQNTANPGRKGKRGDGKRSRGGKGREGMSIKGLDANDDGKISQAEFIARSTERFEKIDTNADGVVTMKEIQDRAPNL